MAILSESEAFFPPAVTNNFQVLSSAIAATSESLSSYPASQLNPQLRSYTQRFHSLCAELLRLLNEKPGLTRTLNDSIHIEPAAVYNLRYEFECVRDAFMSAAKQKRIDLSLSIADVVPVAYWDINNLRRYVLNTILSNAINNTPVGGAVALSIQLQDNYTMSIVISNYGLDNVLADREQRMQNHQNFDRYSTCLDDLGEALQCVQAHLGKLTVTDEPELSGSTIKIEMPLYSLCLQRAH